MINKKTFGLFLTITIIFIFPVILVQAQVSILFTKTLQRGVSDNQVRELQEFLKKSPDIYPRGLVTGYFGVLTEAAVKLFQKREGIDQVGIVGPITRARLNTLLSAGTSIITPRQEQINLPTIKVESEFPVHINIPSINVNAGFEYVGLTPLGAMDIPKGPSDVAWFSLGPRPGQIGSAVISGHYGWKDNIPAVFDNLHKLQKGDKIYVQNEKRETIVFVVRELRTYGENDDASDVFSSTDGMAHLNLITCQGIWNEANKSYSNRLVVFADREI